MAFIFSWIKKSLYYLRDSGKEILIGCFLVLFSISGLITASIIRYLGFNGILISLISIIVEIIAIIFSYFIFVTFFKEKEGTTEKESKKL
ncbi:MAG: hypothetical protein EU547_00175 [Promethearchaeota archaeon]|nr:MAG: hypothetical protein EU547_00175 [Candidatus Lokiarchaeota archaeon]